MNQNIKNIKRRNKISLNNSYDIITQSKSISSVQFAAHNLSLQFATQISNAANQSQYPLNVNIFLYLLLFLLCA